MTFEQQTPAHRFYVTHVDPAYADWSANEASVRHGMNLAIALNQLADYYFQSFPANDARLFGATNVNRLRQRLGDGCPAFLLVRDLADAHKHLTLDRGDRVVTSAEQTEVGSLGWGEAEWGEGRWGSPPELVVTLDDGQRRHFSAVVRPVVAMWRELLGLPLG